MGLSDFLKKHKGKIAAASALAAGIAGGNAMRQHKMNKAAATAYNKHKIHDVSGSILSNAVQSHLRGDSKKAVVGNAIINGLGSVAKHAVIERANKNKNTGFWNKNKQSEMNMSHSNIVDKVVTAAKDLHTAAREKDMHRRLDDIEAYSRSRSSMQDHGRKNQPIGFIRY